jgi:hypothetical protein
MKLLIVLLSLVALTKADDDFQTCFKEATAFKSCACEQAVVIGKKNMEQLKGFKTAIDECFQLPGVKGVCTFPTPPPRPASGAGPLEGAAAPHPPLQMGSLPAEAAACMEGAKNEFLTCFKDKAGIPADFNPPQGPNGQPQLACRPPAPMPLLPFPHDPQEINALALSVCNQNSNASKALIKCAFTKIEPFKLALAGLMDPMVIACQAGAACAKTTSISDSCKVKLAKGREAFCECREKPVAYIRSSGTCLAARSAFSKEHPDVVVAAANQTAHGISDGHHDMPPHANMAFDLCQSGDDAKPPKPDEICKNLLAKLSPKP